MRTGAVDTADALVAANREPSSLTVHFLNAASLVVADGQGNGLIINAAADPAFVSEMIGSVAQLSGNTFDLGQEDGINVVFTKF